jgi:hypothetical protein
LLPPEWSWGLGRGRVTFPSSFTQLEPACLLWIDLGLI